MPRQVAEDRKVVRIPRTTSDSQMVMSNNRLLPFSQLLKQLDRDLGVALHVSTLHRWRTQGVRGQRLNATRLGGRWFARMEDIVGLMQGDPPETIKPSPAARAAVAQAQLAARHNLPVPTAE